MDPVGEAFTLVVRLDLLDLESVRPRVRHDLAGSFEVVLDVTLAADERAHLLTARIAIGVVVGDALLGLEGFDAGDEAGPRDANRHRLGLVAVDAGDRMLDERLLFVVLHIARVAVRHPGDLLEALADVALAGEAIEREVGRVTLDARAGLLLLGHPPRRFLVEERVGVTAPVAVIERERVAREDALEPGIAAELLLGGPAVARPEPASTVFRRRRQRGLQIGVVLHRPVLAPHPRVERVLGHVDEPNERLPRFLLALEDVRQEREQQHGDARDPDQPQHSQEPTAFHSSSWLSRPRRDRRRRDNACNRVRRRCGRARRRWRARGRRGTARS